MCKRKAEFPHFLLEEHILLKDSVDFLKFVWRTSDCHFSYVFEGEFNLDDASGFLFSEFAFELSDHGVGYLEIRTLEAKF